MSSTAEAPAVPVITMSNGTRLIATLSWRDYIRTHPDLIRKAFEPARWERLITVVLRRGDRRPLIRVPTRWRIRREKGTWRWR